MRIDFNTFFFWLMLAIVFMVIVNTISYIKEEKERKKLSLSYMLHVMSIRNNYGQDKDNRNVKGNYSPSYPVGTYKESIPLLASKNSKVISAVSTFCAVFLALIVFKIFM